MENDLVMENDLYESEYIPVTVFEDDEDLDAERDDDYYSSNFSRKRVYLKNLEPMHASEPEQKKKRTFAEAVSNFIYYNKTLLTGAAIAAVVIAVYFLIIL